MPICTGGGGMRLFKQEEKSTHMINGNETRGPDGSLKETAPAQEATTSISSLTDYNISAPAGWYPDPNDPSVLRYWDGVAWAARTQPIPSPPPAPAPGAAATNAVALPGTLENTPAPASARDGETERDESRADDRPPEKGDTDTWVGLTERAVAKAHAVGTFAAWQNAAQAAGVVAEMAQTMRVTAHAHQIAEQLAQEAKVAAQHAQAAMKAAADATRTAEQTAQAAQVAAQEAHAATLAAANAKQRAEQMAQAAPKAIDAAETAAQAAATTKGTVEQLDQVVAKARHANTPEAWNEARHIVTSTWPMDPDLLSRPGGGQAGAVQ